MTPKFSAKEANEVLTRLDKMATYIQANHAKLGMTKDAAKPLVNEIDKIADLVERASMGEKSFLTRQAEVLQKESDEGYMATFENPMKPIQTDSDESYMGAFKDDQSSAVVHGKSTTGKPLAP